MRALPSRWKRSMGKGTIMKRRYGIRSLLAVLLCATLAFLMQTGTASATSLIDTAQSSSLTLTYVKSDTALKSDSVRIYKVASVSEADEYTLTGAFASYAVKLDTAFSADEWSSAAETLAGYVTADQIAATDATETNGSGVASFKPLTTGLYLVVTDKITQDGTTYVVSPFLIQVPNIDADGNWSYDVVAYPKISTPTTPGGSSAYKVVKLWADTGNESARPTSITVDILKNGEKYTTQTLNTSNDWSYAWKASNDGSVWSVVERDVPDGYSVVVTNEDTATFTLTNTYNTPSTPTPSTSTPTPSTSTYTPSTVTESTTKYTSGGDVPKMGDTINGWPIALLAFAGMVGIVIGCRTRRARVAAATGPEASCERSGASLYGNSRSRTERKTDGNGDHRSA